MPSILDYNPGVDALQSLGQVGPAIGRGQYQGMELGLQRQRLLMDYALRQQEMQRLAQQAQQLQQYRQQEQQLGQQRADEERKFHVQQQNQFALKYHDTMMKHRLADKGKFKPLPGRDDILFNDVTGETKQIGGTSLGQVGGVARQGPKLEAADTAALGHVLGALPYFPPNSTNYPTVGPALTNMLGQLQGRMFPQQQPMVTNLAPPVPQAPRANLRYDPATGQFSPPMTNQPPVVPQSGPPLGDTSYMRSMTTYPGQ